MRTGPISFLALLTAAPLALAAQRQASVGAGTGVVRYAGGSSFSALTVAPAAQSLSSSFYLAANAAAPGGNSAHRRSSASAARPPDSSAPGIRMSSEAFRTTVAGQWARCG